MPGKFETYVDGPETRTVTRGHILIHRLHCIAAAHLAVLLIHVVRAGAGVVADPDTERLDLLRARLGDLRKCHYAVLHSLSHKETNLVQADDLAVGLLDLAELAAVYSAIPFHTTCMFSFLPQEVPEPALCHDIVGREDAHAHQLGVLIVCRGQMAANDLVFLQTACWATGQRAVLQKVFHYVCQMICVPFSFFVRIISARRCASALKFCYGAAARLARKIGGFDGGGCLPICTFVSVMARI